MRTYLRHHWWWVTPIVVAIGLNTVLWYALKEAGPVRERFAADQASLSAPFVPTALTADSSEEVEPGKYDDTPAGGFVADLAQLPVDDLLPPKKFTALSPNLGGPAAVLPQCFKLPDGFPSYTATPSGSKLPGITFTVLTTPTGAGAATVANWQQAIWNCRQVSRSYASNVLPSNTAGGFVATTSVAGSASRLSHAIWARGDVIMAVTASNEIDTKNLQQIVETLDTTVTSRLRPICKNLNPTVSDATRNPEHPNYQVLTKTRTVTWEAPLQLPSPTKYRPTGRELGVTLPEPSPQPDLAPVTEFDPDSPNLPVDEAPRETPPTLVDVAQLPVVRQVSDPGLAPKSPEPPAPNFTYPNPIADKDGPGCGWEFTDTSPPDLSNKKLQQLQEAAKQKAFTQAQRERGRAWVNHFAWIQKWEQWSVQDAQHRQYVNLQQRIAEAAEKWAEAEERHELSIQEYETAWHEYWQNQDTPAPGGDNPAPTPSPTPEPGENLDPTVPAPDGEELPPPGDDSDPGRDEQSGIAPWARP